MAWEKRGNSRQYFYLCKRLPDGRVHKQYYGKGLRAEVESMRLELKARKREEEQTRQSKFHYLDLLADECMRSFLQLFEAHLYAAGYHNPKSRGWRKRRSGQMIKQMECEQRNHEDAEPEPGEAVTEQVTLEELVRRCRSGERDAVVTLRRVMSEHPDLFSRHGHIAAKIQAEWIRAISGPDLFEREVMFKSTRELRHGLLDEGTGSHLERLTADQVVATHLEQGFHQLIEARCVGKGLELPKFQVDSSQRANRRHEKSLAALTTIRALTPRVESPAEVVIEEAIEDEGQEQTVWRVPAAANRLTAVFDRTLHPVPMN